MVSPAEATSMACWIVMQGIKDDVQLFAVSIPPLLTYRSAAAAADAPIANRTANTAQWPRLFGLRVTDVVVVFVPVAVIILVAFPVFSGWRKSSREELPFRASSLFCGHLPSYGP